MDDRYKQEWEKLAAFRKRLDGAPAPSFGPYFSSRVMRAVAQMESFEASPESLYRGLFAAFSRIGLAGMAAMLLMFVWIRVYPHAEKEIHEVDQSLEQELESAGYQNLEEII